MKFNHEERKGIYAVAKVITEELNWIFRESPTPDVGVDAYIEICEQRAATGKILALQIKSGESYFLETTAEGVFYRADNKHLKYWKNYSVPILLVLHNPKESKSYWQALDEQYLLKTGRNWKLFIPFYQQFDFKNYNALYTIASYHQKYLYQLDNLRYFKPVMIDLEKGTSWTLYIDTEPGFKRRKGIPHYVNLHFLQKNIVAFNPYEHESDFSYSFTIYGKAPLFESLKKLLPWTDITYVNSSGNEEEEVLRLLENLKEYTWWPEFEKEAKSDLNSDFTKINLPELGSYVDFGVVIEAKLKINAFGQSFLAVNQHLNSNILNWGEEI